MFKVYVGQKQLSYKSFVFKGGEVSVALSEPIPDGASSPITLVANIESSENVMELLMLTDALKRMYHGSQIFLFLGYFPYARQDRVMEPGQSLSVKVMADLINAQDYTQVTIWDAHSDVTPALLDRVVNVEQHKLLSRFIVDNRLHDCILVAPDAGALKKTMKAAQAFTMDMVRADKNRDVRTGQILETVVYTDDVGERDFLIIDDICDGGRTFTELATVLKKKTRGRVYLYVSHGIFSKGVYEVFDGVIDGIFCHNVFRSVSPYSIDNYISAGNVFKFTGGK